MASKQTRQVKLQPEYRKQAYRDKIVPSLRLSGVWLEENGFKVGDTVRITTREKLLVIELLEEDETFRLERDYKSAIVEVKQTLKKLTR